MRGPPTDDTRQFFPLQVRGIALDPKEKTPILLLTDPGGRLVLPIKIGSFEAAAIAVRLQKRRLARPMTHDLLAQTIEALGAGLLRVDLRLIKGGLYAADVILRDAAGRGIRIDARPSDAVAVALRFEAPIRAERAVMLAASPMEKEPAPLQSLAVSVDDTAGLARLVEQLAQVEPDALGEYET